MAFNYGKLHFFDKSGTELMLKRTNSVTLTIINPDYPSFQCVYSFVSSSSDHSDAFLLKIKDGARYKQKSSYQVKVTLSNGTSHTVEMPDESFEWIEYNSSDTDLNGYPDLVLDDTDMVKRHKFIQYLGLENIETPTMTFEGNLVFDKVSTELVETQSIFVLTESTDVSYQNNFDIPAMMDVKAYTKYADIGIPEATSALKYIDRYNLFFFIDCRKQTDFRFFGVDGDDVVWSDRHTMDFHYGRTNGSDNGFRVDIGFKGELEGVYDQKLYVCLLNRDTQDVTVIGSFNMTAETEGEDERYRAFIANFGLPDMDETEPAFRDSDPNDDLPDFVSRNKHAKKLFLAYSDIFPYSGSYKSLANAVKFLGYDDIFFKEWYKDIGKPTPEDDGYVAFDMSFKSNPRGNTINNRSIEERIHLKKMNWISMMYNLNEEIAGTEDKWGFPLVQDTTNYYNAGNLLKLISLKEWLDKYIVGVNSRITDVGGEGVVFERYNLVNIGNYQQVFDYTNEKPLSVTVDSTVSTIIDGSANIEVSVNTSEGYTTFEDFKGQKIIDLCDGWFDDTYTFHDNVDMSLNDSSLFVYFGKTFELHDNMSTFELRARGTDKSFKFNNQDFIDSSHPQLIVDNDKIMFDPFDLITKPKNSMFKNLPTITVYEGKIKRYKAGEENTGELSYLAYIDPLPTRGVKVKYINFDSQEQGEYFLKDDLLLVPPTHTETASYVTLKPRFSSTSSRVSKNGKYIISEPGSSLSNLQPNPYDNLTYGFRVSNETFNGNLVFKIAGYESSEIFLDMNSVFPVQNNVANSEPYEYVIEILNGSVVFNDVENNRKVALNFAYDGSEMTITVNNFQYSTNFTLYKYKTGTSSFTNRFTNNVSYQYFVNGYLNDTENYIDTGVKHNINVYNTGTYDIDVVILDEYNNMFCERANKQVIVITPDIDASTFTLDSSTRTKYAQKGVHPTSEISQSIAQMGYDAGDRCIYEYVPKESIQSFKSEKRVMYTTALNTSFHDYEDVGSVPFKTNEGHKFAFISNTTDRFTYIGRYNLKFSYRSTPSKVFSFIRQSIRSHDYGSTGMNEYEDIVLSSMRDNLYNPNNGYMANTMLNAFYGMSLDASTGSLADVMVVLYDESSEFPLYSYPGIAIPLWKYQYSNIYKYDEVRVILDENVLTENEIEEFTECAKKPYVTTYIIPTWSLKVEMSGQNTTKIKEKENIIYPFVKNILIGSEYRLSFINHNDLPPDPIDTNVPEYKYRNVSAEVIPSKKTIYLKYGYGEKDFPHYDYIDSSTSQHSITQTVDIISDVKTYYIQPPAPEPRYPTVSDAWGHSTFGVNSFRRADGNIFLDGKVNSIYTNTDKDRVHLYFSHSAKDYNDFILEVDPRSDFRNGCVAVKDNITYKDFMYYIDTTYSVSLRDFNVRNGIILWHDMNAASIQNMYMYNLPVSTISDRVIIVPDLSNEFHSGTSIGNLNNNSVTIKWGIYRQRENAEHSLLFECYNRVLFLYLTDPGTYDIKMTMYDRYGNKYIKDFTGLITRE